MVAILSHTFLLPVKTSERKTTFLVLIVIKIAAAWRPLATDTGLRTQGEFVVLSLKYFVIMFQNPLKSKQNPPCFMNMVLAIRGTSISFVAGELVRMF